MPTTTLGLLVGLALGAVIAFGDFTKFVIVAVAAVVGYVVGKVLDGQLDLTPYLGGARRRP